MKAITIWQPWASLLACGAKKYETRSWATHYRGPIAIHAAARLPAILKTVLHPGFIRAVQQALFSDSTHVDMWSNIAQLLPRGAVIATAELVGCREIQDDGAAIDNPSRRLTRYIQRPYYVREYIQGNEFMFGDWTPGRYAWEFANMKMLDEPIPAKGGQRIWNWSA